MLIGHIFAEELRRSMERILNNFKTEPLSRGNVRFVLWRFLLLWLSLALVAGVGMWAFFRAESKKADRMERMQATAVVRNSGSVAKARLEMVVQDVRYLVLVAEQLNLPQQSTESNIQRLADTFVSLMASRPAAYDQIRLLDASGMELVRVNHKPGAEPTVIGKKELQDKSKRYYVRQTLALQSGEIYISPLDLNVDHGVVEMPTKPMLRFGSPLYNANSQVQGMILINYLAKGLLDHLKLDAQLHEKDVWLLNDKGYWLLADSPEKEWGFMFQDKGQVSFVSEYPALWQAIQEQPIAGQRAIAGGLLTYARFSPYRQLSPAQISRVADESAWTMVEFLPKSHFEATIGQLKQRLILTWIAVSGLFGLASFYSALLLLRRKLLLDDLSQSKHYAEILLASTPDAIFVCNVDGHILLTNDQANWLFGYSQEELLGNSIDILVPKAQRKGHAALRSQYTNNPRRRGMGEGLDLFAERKDGSLFPVNTSLNYIGEGSKMLVIAEVRDVSLEHDAAQKIIRLNQDLSRQNELLTQVKERFELSAQASGVGIWDWDMVHDQLFWDEQMFLLYGVKPEQFNNRYEDWFALVYPADRERCLQAVQDALQNRTKLEIEYRIQKADGSLRFLNGIGRVFYDENGRPVRMLGSNLDITEQKELELRLIEGSEKLELRVAERTAELDEARRNAEQLTQVKSQFLANMSHEIRTPLNAILGLAYILEKSKLPADLAGMAQKICNAGRSLQAMINDVLDLSKLEAGRLNIEHEAFRMDDVLDNLSTIIAANLGNKPIEVAIEPPPPEANHLIGDSLRLGQILINLASNAIKFTAHGHVVVKISLPEQDESGDRISLLFSVSDTGIGISADKQKEIFEPFGQADISTSRQFGGTGLGLTICRQLVELMGGEFWVNSELGKGSEFAFSLSFEKAKLDECSQPEMKGLKVVIADDNDIARDAIAHTVQSLGWEAMAFSSGSELIEYVMQSQTGSDVGNNVILLDWIMPELDGLSTARKIHEQFGGTYKPIIIMISGYPLDQFASKPGADLVDAVISKPITASQLYDTIVKLQQKNKVLTGPSEQTLRRMQGLRILVVDDNDINCDVAQYIFADEGAEVSVAGNGLQALEIIQAAPDHYDIVLMDLQMPVMDGFQAARAIKALPGLDSLPVVALTAGAFNDHQELATASGMDGFISKPFNVDAAINTILKATGRALSPRVHQSLGLKQTPDPAIAHGLPDLPEIDLQLGLSTWKDIAIYKKYLGKFVRDYSGFIEQLSDDNADASVIAAAAHKIIGAAGNLGLTVVMTSAEKLEQQIRSNQQVDHGKNRLREALKTAMVSIEQFLGEDEEDAKPLSPTEVGVLQPLLKEALAALDTDSPDAIEVIIEKLASYLSKNQLQPLCQAVENFDFRAGEQAVRQLAEQLGLSMGN